MNVISPIHAPDMLEETVLTRLFGDLAKAGIAHAVLRNYEQLPYRLGARDIDIVVTPENLAAAIAVVVDLANSFGFQFANHYADERMTQLGLWKRREAEVFDLKIDFFTASQVYGIELLPAREMLRDLRWHNGIPVVSDVVLLLDKWLFHLAVAKPLNPKYDALFGRIAREHPRPLLASLTPLLGDEAARAQVAAMAAGQGSMLAPMPAGERIRLLTRMLGRTGGGRVALMARFVGERLRNRLRPHGTLISVSGPDGSGKTTVIDLVLAQLRQGYGSDSVEYHHFRPTVLPRIAEMAKVTGAVDSVDRDYARPHRAMPSGMTGSAVRLGYYALDYVLGYFLRLRPALTDRKMIVFDRYYYDMICDPGRSRIRLPGWALKLVGRLLPLPQFAFFIHVTPALAHARKQELTLEQITALNQRYGALAASGWMVEIGNDGPAANAASAIVDRIIAHHDALARRALGVAVR
jgi:thymidylate kinase